MIGNYSLIEGVSKDFEVSEFQHPQRLIRDTLFEKKCEYGRLKIYFLFVFLIIGIFSSGQQPQSQWCFGYGAQVDFSGAFPVALLNPNINASEAVASVADDNGALLFYTDGITVWNSNHQVMPNGSGLLGGNSSTQILIIKNPGSCNEYYIFHVEDHQLATRNLYYSIVDMCLDNGLGDVVSGEKNIFVDAPMGEKLTAIPHINGSDMWIVGHRLLNNEYVAFLLSDTGLAAPVVSSTGGTYPYDATIGHLKASPLGTRIVASSTFFFVYDLSDFDPATGVVSNSVNMYDYFSASQFYGFEFSPNGQFLYATTTNNNNRLYQIDLSDYSYDLVSSGNNGAYEYGALETAVDGKIYMARNNQPYIASISFPDLAWPNCIYTEQAIDLVPGTTCAMGLPQEVWSSANSFTQFDIDLGPDTSICVMDYVLNLTPPCGANILWSDGSALDSLVIDSAGTYSVSVTSSCGAATDTVVIGLDSLSISIRPDTTICSGQPVQLWATGGTDYDWLPATTLDDPQSETPIAIPDSTTTYVVSVSNGACQGTDSVTIFVIQSQFAFDVTSSEIICDQAGSIAVSNIVGGTAPYTLNFDGEIYSESSEIFSTIISHDFTIQDDEGCSAQFVLSIPDSSYVPLLQYDLIHPLCEIPGSIQFLEAFPTEGNILIELSGSSSTDSLFQNLQPGMYELAVTDSNGCYGSVNIELELMENNLEVQLNITDAICEDQGTFEVEDISGGIAPYSITFEGSVISQDSVLNLDAGVYSLLMTDSAGCIGDSTVIINITFDSTQLELNMNPARCLLPGQIDIIGFTGGASPYEVLINGLAITGDSIQVSEGIYNLIVQDDHGCISDTTIIVGNDNNVLAEFVVDPMTGEAPLFVTTDNQSVNANQYFWFLDGDSLSQTDNVNLNLLVTGEYLLELVALDSASGCVDTASVIIVVLDMPAIYVPNAFTPDGDGINDTFGVEGIGIDENNFLLQIFNRWGAVIWEGQRKEDRWIGSGGEKGYFAPDGVYVYKLTFRFEDDLDLQYIVGHVLLMR